MKVLARVEERKRIEASEAAAKKIATLAVPIMPRSLASKFSELDESALYYTADNWPTHFEDRRIFVLNNPDKLVELAESSASITEIGLVLGFGTIKKFRAWLKDNKLVGVFEEGLKDSAVTIEQRIEREHVCLAALIADTIDVGEAACDLATASLDEERSHEKERLVALADIEQRRYDNRTKILPIKATQVKQYAADLAGRATRRDSTYNGKAAHAHDASTPRSVNINIGLASSNKQETCVNATVDATTVVQLANEFSVSL